MLSKQASPRIVVLKADRLYGDLICRQIKELWRNATILVFQHGFDALEAIQAEPPDLFVAGVKIDDMDYGDTAETEVVSKAGGRELRIKSKQRRVGVCSG